MIGPLIDRLQDELRRIWCYRWLAAGVAVAIFGAVAVYTATIPNTYEAWGQVYVNQQTPLTAAAEGVSLVGENYGSPHFVQKTLLHEDNLMSVVRRLYASDRTMSEDDLAAAASGLRGQVRVVDNGDGFIEIYFVDQDPERARQVVGLLLDQFIFRNVSRSWADLGRAGAFLDEQIASYERMMSQSQAAIGAFRRRHPGSFSSGEAMVTELVSEPAGAQAAAAPSAASQRLAQAERELAGLLTSYTDRHPDVIAARRRVSEAAAESQLEAAASAAPVQAQTRQVLRRRAPTPLPPEAASQLSELTRRDEMLRATYEQLVARRAAAQMSQDVYGSDRGGKYQITREPVTPSTPIGPDRPLYLAAGLVLALGAGLGAAFLRASMRGILVSAREVEDIIQLPVIGTVSWEPAWRSRPRFAGPFQGARRSSRAPAPRIPDFQMETAR